MKQKRIVDKKLLKRLQGSPCIICETPGNAHHQRRKGAGGDDVINNLMVLCFPHHRLIHDKGDVYMVDRYPQVLDWLIDHGWELDEFTGKWVRYS